MSPQTSEAAEKIKALSWEDLLDLFQHLADSGSDEANGKLLTHLGKWVIGSAVMRNLAKVRDATR